MLHCLHHLARFAVAVRAKALCRGKPSLGVVQSGDGSCAVRWHEFGHGWRGRVRLFIWLHSHLQALCTAKERIRFRMEQRLGAIRSAQSRAMLSEEIEGEFPLLTMTDEDFIQMAERD